MIYRRYRFLSAAPNKPPSARGAGGSERTFQGIGQDPEPLDKLYRRSIYFIDKKGIVFRINEKTRWRGAILSAWNPASQRRSEIVNRKWDHRLLRALAGHPAVPMWGGTDVWWERHFWVANLSLAEAMRISIILKQKAFIFLDGQHIRLIWCYTGKIS
ncbi:DUF3293 domain-containing protein [Igneacidithiobacillus siniensis]|uniref:DUF3293 domain-containing protein n=1 Tax=Acidithiobacillus TaxID=119977 RepID=UPI00200C6E0E|nr:DUF3293 domain-containing protein [Acidithiobacillus sp. S30A2]